MNILFTPPKNKPIKYGPLFNWYAATDVRGISSSSEWKVPLWEDYNILSTFLGGNSVSGGKMKETGLLYWVSPNTDATNESGFNGRGAGARSDAHDPIYAGEFDGTIGGNLHLWIRTELDELLAWSCYLETYSGTFNNWNDFGKSTGISIRLVKDSTTLSNGQTGTYIGNDGRIYQTICIGTKEWLAENLAETKFSNGNLIPVVTDNAAWSILTTGAMCYYNNDINNR